MLQTFFDAIVREDKDTQLSVQEAMSMMAPAFRRMDPDNLRQGSHFQSKFACNHMATLM